MIYDTMRRGTLGTTKPTPGCYSETKREKGPKMFFGFNTYRPEHNLPIIAGSTGWTRPKGVPIVATLIPERCGTVKIQAPWGLLDGIGGQHYHQIRTLHDDKTGKIDEYPNDKFEQDFEVIKVLKPGEDERADRLFELYGNDAKVVLARKVEIAIVRGIAKKKCKFVTSESKGGDKVHTVNPNDVFLSNQDGSRHWVVAANTFADLYTGINNGPMPTKN